MIKRKILKLSAICLLPISTAFAAGEACKAPGDEQYIATGMFAKGENLEGVKKVLSEYCYLPENYHKYGIEIPSMWSSDVNYLEYFDKKDRHFMMRKNKWGQSLLSQVMIDGFVFAPLDPDEIKYIKEYAVKYNVPMKPYEPIKPKNQQEMINWLLKNSGQFSTREMDGYGLNELAYSIISVEPAVFESINPTYLALYMKYDRGFAPIHLFFAPHYSIEDNKDKLIQLNEILLKKANIKSLQKLGNSFMGLTFFEYAEIMQEYNMDLYEKLKSRSDFNIRDKYKDPKEKELKKKQILADIDFKVIYESYLKKIDKN